MLSFMTSKLLALVRQKWTPWVGAVVVLPITALLLHFQGRIWSCACGKLYPWAGDIWTSHNSQHLFDPYSFTHVLHGVIFYGLLAWLVPRLTREWRFSLATLLECGWELLENSEIVIQRYRDSTASLGYAGDSIYNAMGDIVSCAAGFWVARYLGLRWSVVFIIVVELVLLAWIRDNLTLNIVMLLHPIEAIKNWQMVH